MSTLKGTVKWFSGKKGFGFIEREDKEKDCFVHVSAVKASGMRYLQEGDKIEIESLRIMIEKVSKNKPDKIRIEKIK